MLIGYLRLTDRTMADHVIRISDYVYRQLDSLKGAQNHKSACEKCGKVFTVHEEGKQ